MKNIHIIPTDKPSRLHTYKGVLNLAADEFVAPTIVKNDLINLNIYITSDEEIKDVRPHKGKWQLEQEQILNKFPTYLTDLSECKLVIMTTDQDLIKDGVQAIDDEFLEWFVKNPSCERVEIKQNQHFESDKTKRDNPLNGVYYSYKIIIPVEEPKHNCRYSKAMNQPYPRLCVDCGKEEPKQEKLTYTESAKKEERISNCIMMKRKQETLEEVAERYASQFIKGKIVYHGFIEGAEWMQERMYSEEDMRKAFIAGGNGFLEYIEGTYSYSNIYDHWYLHSDTSKTYSKKELLKVYLKRNKL